MSDSYAENHQNDPPDDGHIYIFERYVRGRKMAQGVRVNRAISETHAEEIARNILHREGAHWDEIQDTKLVLVETID